MLFGSTKVIGLDIGTSTIKLVELNVNRGTAEVISFGVAPTPQAAVMNGEILDSLPISETVTRILEQVKTKRKRVATGLWGTSVIVKRINVPQMDESLLQEQIKWEAEQYIPFDMSEVSIDFHLIPEHRSQDVMEVLLVAAKNETVYRYAELVENSGLECSVVDVNGFALANCFEFNYGNSQKEVIGLLNVGAACTNFVVLENGHTSFVRDIPVGGGNYTADIQSHLGVSLDEAESLKISAGIGQEVPEEVFDVLTSSNELFLEELQRSIDFYQASSNAGEIKRFYITGGSIALPNLLESLQNGLNVPVEIMNPFKKIKYNDKKFNADYIAQISNFVSVPLGLALRKGTK
ncbi:MAG: type IV pilus assembly protein PilM [Bdellovibrionota bacterium]|nr:fimbrial assembly protein [Pseudobdellovibrionaceae bacterium]|tara:strand:- start:10844 stop:11893 length:1050 start_codon:yes stop_codon:yes gene_type:complete